MTVPVTIGIATMPIDTSTINDWKSLQFRFNDLDDPEFLWCDSEGSRPGSLAVGIGLIPILPPGTPVGDLQDGAIYLDITIDEIRKLQAQLQRLIDDNTETA